MGARLEGAGRVFVWMDGGLEAEKFASKGGDGDVKWASRRWTLRESLRKDCVVIGEVDGGVGVEGVLLVKRSSCRCITHALERRLRR